MRNFWLSLTLLVVLVLSACTPANPAAIVVPTLPKPQGNSTPPTCTTVARNPTPGPTETSLFPPVVDSDWVVGPATAKVTIVEYSDFQCPFCATLAPVLKQLQQNFPQDVRIVFRHDPLNIHANSLLAAQASEAAGIQGKFWQMYDALFTEQSKWSGLSAADFETWLMEQAKQLKLDTAKFQTDLKSPELVKKAQDGRDNSVKIGIPGTPFVLINGRPYQGPGDLGNYSAIVKLLKLEDKQFTECPAMTIDPKKQYIATLKTEKGDVVIQLYPEIAPMAVNSFVFLANNKWFADTTFHRVLPGYIAQAGDPTGTGYGNPGYTYGIETNAAVKFDKEGVVGMANSGPTSNGSQFFITYAAAANLNGAYTIFGQVLQGMDVLKTFPERDPSKSATLPDGVKIISVTIEEK